MNLMMILAGATLMASPHKPIRVVIWDEQQPAQLQVYPNHLGNHIADHLRQNPGITVKTVRLDDPNQGLAKEVLDNCDVLIWWGHQRHDEVKDELALDIVKRVESGHLSLFALHSAHWSKPFIESMNARAVSDALKSLPADLRDKVTIVKIPAEKRLTRADEAPTPSFDVKANAAGGQILEVKLPSCVFPAVRADGKASHVTTLLPKHPIAKGISAAFDIPHTEMYAEHFNVPKPDAVVFEEKWDLGERFRAGCVWKVGKGTVFYFRPGHETFDVFRQPNVLKIVENAVLWLGSGKR